MQIDSCGSFTNLQTIHFRNTCLRATQREKLYRFLVNWYLINVFTEHSRLFMKGHHVFHALVGIKRSNQHRKQFNNAIFFYYRALSTPFLDNDAIYQFQSFFNLKKFLPENRFCCPNNNLIQTAVWNDRPGTKIR